MDSDQQHKAHLAVKRALHAGILKRADLCERCYCKTVTVAHHNNGYDDSHILDVQWLCRKCHGQVHGGLLNLTNEQRQLGVKLSREYCKSSQARVRQSEALKKVWEQRTDVDERSAYGKRASLVAHANRTPEQNHDIAVRARQGWVKFTHEERSAIARRAWVTRRANALRDKKRSETVVVIDSE